MIMLVAQGGEVLVGRAVVKVLVLLHFNCVQQFGYQEALVFTESAKRDVGFE